MGLHNCHIDMNAQCLPGSGLGQPCRVDTLQQDQILPPEHLESWWGITAAVVNVTELWNFRDFIIGKLEYVGLRLVRFGVDKGAMAGAGSQAQNSHKHSKLSEKY